MEDFKNAKAGLRQQYRLSDAKTGSHCEVIMTNTCTKHQAKGA